MIKAMFISIAICLLFSSCSSESMRETKKNNYEFIDKITEDDFKLLEGVNISVRKLGGQVSNFEVQVNNENYKIPVYDSLTTRERIMNPKWYDVEKYALKNEIDNANAYDYVHSYSDKVVLLLNKLNVLGIRNSPELGDFIVFSVGTTLEYSTEEIIYLPKGGNVNHSYWESFFAETKPIKEGWYLRKKELKKN